MKGEMQVFDLMVWKQKNEPTPGMFLDFESYEDAWRQFCDQYVVKLSYTAWKIGELEENDANAHDRLFWEQYLNDLKRKVRDYYTALEGDDES